MEERDTHDLACVRVNGGVNLVEAHALPQGWCSPDSPPTLISWLQRWSCHTGNSELFFILTNLGRCRRPAPLTVKPPSAELRSCLSTSSSRETQLWHCIRNLTMKQGTHLQIEIWVPFRGGFCRDLFVTNRKQKGSLILRHFLFLACCCCFQPETLQRAFPDVASGRETAASGDGSAPAAVA